MKTKRKTKGKSILRFYVNKIEESAEKIMAAVKEATENTNLAGLCLIVANPVIAPVNPTVAAP